MAVTDQGVVVVGDTVEIEQKIAGVLQEIADAPADAWLVHLHVFDLSRSYLSKLGWNGNAALSVSASFGTVLVVTLRLRPRCCRRWSWRPGKTITSVRWCLLCWCCLTVCLRSCLTARRFSFRRPV